MAGCHNKRSNFQKIRCWWFAWFGVFFLNSSPVLATPPVVQIFSRPAFSSGTADCPVDFINSANSVFSTPALSVSSLSSVLQTASQPASVFLYQTGFNATNWTGSLKKYSVSVTTDGSLQIASTPHWEAGDLLTRSVASNRLLYTLNAELAATPTVAFEWAQLNAMQKKQLDMTPLHIKTDGLGAARLNYLHGEQALENSQPEGIFRSRVSLLGDIVNSQPLYVGAPSSAGFGSDYKQFYEAYKNRAPAVYVGANDGMLHAFDAVTGQEWFAYLPAALMGGLNQLSAPDYQHRPYVDGLLTASAARLSAGWKTVLVSSLGGGAQGLFALDITRAADFIHSNGALWEFTDADNPAMGNIMGLPAIGKFRISATSNLAQYRYFAVTGNGLNAYQNDGLGKFDDSARGVLFLLALDKPASERWQEGINYYRLTLPAAEAALQNTSAGLSAPTLVTGPDGAVQYLYAGDLQGNVWRFNFTGNDWPHNLPSVVPAAPFFSARDDQGKSQPVVMPPKILFTPGGGYLVLFGTGKFFEAADALPDSFSAQSLYAVLDTLPKVKTTMQRADLAVRKLTVVTAESDQPVRIGGDSFSYSDNQSNQGNKGKQGWYLDFPDSQIRGERSLTPLLTVYGRVFFNTFIPATMACQLPASRSYELDALSGFCHRGQFNWFSVSARDSGNTRFAGNLFCDASRQKWTTAIHHRKKICSSQHDRWRQKRKTSFDRQQNRPRDRVGRPLELA